MVKYFHSNMPGAPVLSGTAGAMIAILDACVVNGFGLKSVDSLVIAGGVATMTISSGMTFEADAVVLIAGITGGAAALNGDQRILSISGNTATFSAAGVSDQTATGTITAKMSPLGWAKPFSGTNVAAYKPTDPTALGMYLRVDDTGTTTARVVGYESMIDINTGSGPFPTAVQISGGGYWEKSGGAESTARNWIVVGDERAFYWWCVPNAPTTVTSQGVLRGAGDGIPRRSTDAYASFLQCASSSLVTTSGDCFDLFNSASSQVALFFPRDQTALGSSVQSAQYAQSRRGVANSNQKSGVQAYPVSPYPNPSDNALDLERLLFLSPDLGVRAMAPGLYHIAQNVGYALSTWDKIAGQGDLLGRKLLVVRGAAPSVQSQNSGNYIGCACIDITGPWR